MDVPPSRCLETSGEYSIRRLNTIALSGKRYLVIVHEVDQWKDTKEIEQRNKNLISTFAKRFPEYPMFLEDSCRKRRYAVETTGWRTVQEKAAIPPIGQSQLRSILGAQNATRRPKGRAAAAINIFPGASRSGF